jgi:hypothetical protein
MASFTWLSELLALAARPITLIPQKQKCIRLRENKKLWYLVNLKKKRFNQNKNI